MPPAPGKSLAAALKSDVTIERASLWWLHEDNKAIRIGDYKLVAAKNDPWELYDLRTDRAEQHNLASQMPDKVKELTQSWEKQLVAYSELAQKTLSEQTKGKAGKGKKGKGKDVVQE